MSSHPKTDRGKAASAKNVTDFDELQHALLDEIDPVGALETAVFNQLVHATWKQQSIRRMEQALLDRGPEAIEDENTARTLDRLNRYAAAADRAWYRALKEIRTMQTSRTMRETIDPQVIEQIPPLADVSSILKQQQGIQQAEDDRRDQELEDLINAPMPDVDLSEIKGKYLQKK